MDLPWDAQRCIGGVRLPARVRLLPMQHECNGRPESGKDNQRHTHAKARAPCCQRRERRPRYEEGDYGRRRYRHSHLARPARPK